MKTWTKTVLEGYEFRRSNVIIGVQVYTKEGGEHILGLQDRKFQNPESNGLALEFVKVYEQGLRVGINQGKEEIQRGLTDLLGIKSLMQEEGVVFKDNFTEQLFEYGVDYY